MPWTRLDDGIYDNPKILAVEPGDRLLYVWALCWSNRHHTDGAIPAKMLRYIAMFAGVDDPAAAAGRLVDAGLWENDVEGWQIHDFTDFQLSTEQRDDIRTKRANAGRVGGQRSAQTRRERAEAESTDQANAAANASAHAQANGKQRGKQKRTPTQPNLVTDVSSSSGPYHHELSTAPDDDEQDQPPTPPPPDVALTGDEAVARAVVEELGRRDSVRSPNRRTVGPHAAACADRRWATERWWLTGLVREHPTATVLELADLAERQAQLATSGAPPGRASPAASPTLHDAEPCPHCRAVSWCPHREPVEPIRWYDDDGWHEIGGGHG